jgi:hypothetical protein
MVELDQKATEIIFMVGNSLAFGVQWYWLYRTKNITCPGTTATILFIMLLMVVVIIVYYFIRGDLGDNKFNWGFAGYGISLLVVSVIIVGFGFAYHRKKLADADALSQTK